MKKISAIEIIVIILVIAVLIIYLAPQILNKKEDKIISQIKADNAIFTSKIIEEFASNANILPSVAAKKTADELNKTQKNPYKRGKDLYIISKDTPGYSNVEYDNNIKMIIVTTIDNNNSIVSRIVINPPSFVSYYKNENK